MATAGRRATAADHTEIRRVRRAEASRRGQHRRGVGRRQSSRLQPRLAEELRRKGMASRRAAAGRRGLPAGEMRKAMRREGRRRTGCRLRPGQVASPGSCSAGLGEARRGIPGAGEEGEGRRELPTGSCRWRPLRSSSAGRKGPSARSSRAGVGAGPGAWAAAGEGEGEWLRSRWGEGCHTAGEAGRRAAAGMVVGHRAAAAGVAAGAPAIPQTWWQCL